VLFLALLAKLLAGMWCYSLTNESYKHEQTNHTSMNKRIIQAWRVGSWPEGTYSIVKFDINESDGLTTVNLEHTGFPEEVAEHLESGWAKMYWEPLKAYLE
jgi:activator of HSP90 ATPase